jgi:hypothetical protein
MDWRDDEWSLLRDVLAPMYFEAEIETGDNLEDEPHQMVHCFLRKSQHFPVVMTFGDVDLATTHDRYSIIASTI